MNDPSRRKFLKQALGIGAGASLVPLPNVGSPTVLSSRRAAASTRAGELIFQPTFVQRGSGPHLRDFAYATDADGDAFRCDIRVTDRGLVISDTSGVSSFGINVRWNVEGFGCLFLTADNGGEFYELPPSGTSRILNLNFELARSRVLRTRRRIERFERNGWKASRESGALQALADGLLEDAARSPESSEQRGLLAQKALHYALWASEKVELEKAQADAASVRHAHFFIGCDARSFFHMDVELFLERFSELFNYATLTYFLLSGTFGDFEAELGRKNFGARDVVFHELRRRGILVEGRPIFWPYKTTTPDWLRHLSYDQLLKYVETHSREVVRHYGDGMYAWEVVNELHDWANECQLNPDQLIEVTRLACDVAKNAQPNVRRLINNCCLFGDYVQRGMWHEIPSRYPQRTPFQFMRQLVEAGVDFDITGVQMYFPYRDLADTIILIERFSDLGKVIQVTEVGATSGPSETSIRLGTAELPRGPYDWHRPWDEELQAEWAEGLYTLAYSKPYIEAVNWYDFVDPHCWIPHGGLLRSTRGEKKVIFDRLVGLTKGWKRLA